MAGVMIEYDHINLRGKWPETWQEVQVVPREGETAEVLGATFVAYRVHWWEPPIEPGHPAARIVLRTPEQYRRLMGRGRRPGGDHSPDARATLPLVRMNISVPDGLAGQVRELGLPVSAICQRALAEAVARRGEDASGGLSARARELAVMLADFADKAGEANQRPTCPD